MINPIPKKSIKLKRWSLEWKNLVAEVFKRDFHTCQICHHNYPAASLCPHHIIPAGRCRFDAEWNLLTVCLACHRKLHDGNLDKSVDDLIVEHGLEGWAC